MRLTGVLTSIFVLVKTCLPVPVPSQSCRNADNFQSQLTQIHAADHQTPALPAKVRSKIDAVNKQSQAILSINTVPVSADVNQFTYGNTSCPETLSSDYTLSLQDRSICPYYYVITRDVRRYPVAIAEARCKCQACVGSGDNVCEPIYFPKVILRYNGCSNGTNQYVSEVYQVQNGCVCAMRRIARSQEQYFETIDTNNEDENYEPTVFA